MPVVRTLFAAFLALAVVAPSSPPFVDPLTEWTSSPQVTTAGAADGTSVTPNASGGSFSAWTQVTASTGADWLLTGVSVLPGSSAVGNEYYIVDVGTGGSGSEAVIGETASGNIVSTANQWLPFAIPIKVASGTRVALRMKKFNNDTTAWKMAITYYALPITGTITYTTAGTMFGSRFSVVPGTAWGNGLWTQVIASTSAATYFVGLGGLDYNGIVTCGLDLSEWEMDLGTGAAASEVVQTTLKNYKGAISSGSHSAFMPLVPALAIPTATRVAIRARAASAGATGCGFIPVFYTGLESDPITNLTTTQTQVWTPAAADATSVTTGSSAWANAASWTQFVASTATAIALTSIVLQPTTGTAADWEIDIGTGGSGSETVVATFRVGNNAVSSMTVIPVTPALSIPTSTRVSVRVRSSIGSAVSAAVALGSIASPSFLQRSSAAHATYPPAATGVSLTPSGTGWNNSSYGQLVSATAARILLTGIAYRCGACAGVEAEFDLATGAAASEVVVSTLRAGMLAQGNNFLALPTPLLVDSGKRIAVRMRKTGTNTTAWTLAATYLTAPAGFPSGLGSSYPALWMIIRRPGHSVQ